MVQGHICIKVMYIDLLNLIFRRTRKFKKNVCFGGLCGILYCVSQVV